jgi:MFS family permease
VSPRRRTAFLGLAIAMALADSSVVTLALPDVLRHFDVSITTVAWVLTAYNLVLALAAVPAAHLARRNPAVVCALGLVVFSAASLACGLAPSFGVLLAGRCAQAVGGAAIVSAALDLLSAVVPTEADAAHTWAKAGVMGAALGPAVGGVLTQLLGWESIFLVQAPLSLLPLAALPALLGYRAAATGPSRPHLAPNVALLFGSAALSAALFLLVVLLVNGWDLHPAAAGAVATVLPVAAIVTGRMWRTAGSTAVRAMTGLLLISGGLAALGLLPHAGWIWTVPPQLLVGVGLGLTIGALTERALRGRSPQAVHGGWTIASRHGGIVLGLLLLTPLFAHQLDHNEGEAKRAGAAIVLDSRLPPLDKFRVAGDVLRSIDRANGRLPDVRAVFEAHFDDPSGAEYRRVANRLQDQLERAVTSAFGWPFLLASALALCALAAVAGTRKAPTL